MGNCCSRSKDTTESEATDGSNGRGDEHASLADVGIGTANLVADSILLVGGAVPVVGDFFDLIAHFKDQWMELVGRIDEANEVATWAQDEIYLLDDIKKQINQRADAGSNVLAEKALKRAAIELNESIKQLVAEANRISADGARAKQIFRGAIHKRHFESAQGRPSRCGADVAEKRRGGRSGDGGRSDAAVHRLW